VTFEIKIWIGHLTRTAQNGKFYIDSQSKLVIRTEYIVAEQWVTGQKLHGCAVCVSTETLITANLAASIDE
jgi:hypothetical protein